MAHVRVEGAYLLRVFPEQPLLRDLRANALWSMPDSVGVHDPHAPSADWSQHVATRLIQRTSVHNNIPESVTETIKDSIAPNQTSGNHIAPTTPQRSLVANASVGADATASTEPQAPLVDLQPEEVSIVPSATPTTEHALNQAAEEGDGLNAAAGEARVELSTSSNEATEAKVHFAASLLDGVERPTPTADVQATDSPLSALPSVRTKW